MKTLIASIAIVSLLSLTQAQEILHNVAIKEITTEVQKTPEFQVSGVKQKRVKQREWIEIEVELKVETLEKSNPSGYIPELQVQWNAIMVDKFELDPKQRTKVLKGETTFEKIRTKDGTAYVSAYISPDTLEKMTGSENPSTADLKAIAVIVSGGGLQPNPGLQKVTAQEGLKWWSSGQFPVLDGLILSKSKTPFAPLWTDRYPMEKEEK